MTRRAAAALLLACAACARREPEMDVFPPSIAGWQRAALRNLPASDSPDPVPQPYVQRAQSADYEGNGKLEARAYELTRPEVGLDIAQRWRPSADTVFFWAKRYFVVVKWQDADRKALQEFTRALENRLNAK
jgi:hypothetical protein